MPAPPQSREDLAVPEQTPLRHAGRFYDAMVRRTRPEVAPAQRCVLVSLAHLVGAESSPAHIYQEVIPAKLEGEELDAELVEIANRASQEAIDNAQTQTSTQAYAFILYSKNEQVLQQHRFNAGPTTQKMIVGGLSEGPSEVGITGQLMRHSEIYMRSLIEAQQRAVSVVAEENDRLRIESQSLRNELENMREKRNADFSLMESLRDGKARRDMETETAREWDARGARVMDLVEKKIVPELLAKYGTGGSGAKEALDVLGQISAEEAAGMITVLTPERQAAFWSLLTDEKKAELRAHNEAEVARQNGRSS